MMQQNYDYLFSNPLLGLKQCRIFGRMKKVSADYIYPGNAAPIKNGVVVYNDNGEIIDLLNPETDEINWKEVEKFEGIICPGFINSHCHLELSHLKGKVNENTQLHGFVKEIISIRDSSTEEEKQEAIRIAEQEMINNGIVAVGDISNGTSTFSFKEKSEIKYHTFVEVFGSDPKIAKEAFEHSNTVFNAYFDKKRASITPHATYSVSDNLSQLINKHAIENESLISIHNQETESENTFFKEGKGDMFDFLNIAEKTDNQFTPTGNNALPSFLDKYNSLQKVLLIHNTFTEKEDVEWSKNYNAEIFWCFCPNANQYIENRQPDYSFFKNEKCTIGTDSLASNWSLSILDEMKAISKKETSVSLQTLIEWATFNGAKFFEFDKLGAIEKGKIPGLNLIKNLNGTKLASNSTVKKII